jgi:S1-C subfamily serine protease
MAREKLSILVMLRLFLFCSLLLFLFLVCVDPSPRAPDTPPVHVKNSVAAAKTGREIFKEADYLAKIHITAERNGTKTAEPFSGAGLLVHYNGRYLVWTASHVVKIPNYSIKTISVVFKRYPERSFPAVVDKINTDLDFASLKLADDKFEFNGNLAKINLETDFEVGGEIYTLGSPLGTDYTLGRGIIMNLRFGNDQIRGIGWERLILHSATIAPGNSGGPLVDAYGRVIGMNIFTHQTFHNYVCAIYIMDILNWMIGR